MFTRVKRGWELTKQSGRVLMADKKLVVFPIMSTIACLLVLASFAVPAALMVDWNGLIDQAAGGSGGHRHQVAAQYYTNPLGWVVVFAFYFVNFFIITFFNAALVSCAMDRFEGRETGVRAGLRAAAGKLPKIAGWAAVSATVGVILKMVEERLGIIGKIVIRFIGMAWTIATYFVVPIMVVENVGPIDAVKRSVEVLKKTWGEALTGNLGISAISGLAALLAFLPGIAGVGLAVATDSPWWLIPGFAITFVLLMLIALVGSTLKVILMAATYRFAATGTAPAKFDGELLSQAFKAKKQK